MIMTKKFCIASSMDGMNELRLQMEYIASAWSLSKRQLFEIDLVLEELCMNFIEHTESVESDNIEIELALENSTVYITILDKGPEFDPTKVAAPDVCLPQHQRKAGGLGLYLVKHYIDKISYKRFHDTNILSIVKKTE